MTADQTKENVAKEPVAAETKAAVNTTPSNNNKPGGGYKPGGNNRTGGSQHRGGYQQRGGGSQKGGFRKKTGNRPRRKFEDDVEVIWVPKTKIGKQVLAGEITDIDTILEAGIPIMEVGIVNKLLPELNEEVLDVRRVQRTLDSGRRMRFSVLATAGDKNGHVGVGIAKGVEAGPTIKKAINRAKLNIIKVKRSCASWECGCGKEHTVPYNITGKMGSVKVTLKPAPKGVGLVAGDNSKKVLEFAGISDVWTSSKGHTRTVINQVLAVYDALKSATSYKEEASGKLKNKSKA